MIQMFWYVTPCLLVSGSQVSEEFPATSYMISVVEGKQVERIQTNKTQVRTEVSYIELNGRKTEPYINMFIHILMSHGPQMKQA